MAFLSVLVSVVIMGVAAHASPRFITKSKLFIAFFLFNYVRVKNDLIFAFVHIYLTVVIHCKNILK